MYILIDVIEHIPADKYKDIFDIFSEVGSESVTIVMTYPSPQYQEYLSRERPEELQIIDNTIQLPDLMAVAEAADFKLVHYSLVDVWMRNQYVHCVLARDVSVRRVESSAREEPIACHHRRKLLGWLQKNTVRRYRRWRYIDQVFRR
jgi:hypothetical protein